MPRDKTRLVINETKQEDQPFIYINEAIRQNLTNSVLERLKGASGPVGGAERAQSPLQEQHNVARREPATHEPDCRQE